MFIKLGKISPKSLPFRGYLIVSLSAIVALGLFIFAIRGFLPPVVPLFYGNAAGEAQLTSFWGLYFGLGAALFVTLFNSILALNLKDDFFKKILIMSSFLFTLLVVATIVKIIFLVGLF